MTENEIAVNAGWCCSPMMRAHEAGTDSELYSSAIHENNAGAEICGGMFDDPLKFCPWCGKALALLLLVPAALLGCV